MKKVANEKLVATAVAREFVLLSVAVQNQLPRGEGELRSQLKRASDSVLLNLCEGAGRFAPRDKARFYDMSVGSGAECLGALECVLARGLAAPADVDSAVAVLRRVIGMVTGLAKSARRRADGPEVKPPPSDGASRGGSASGGVDSASNPGWGTW